MLVLNSENSSTGASDFAPMPLRRRLLVLLLAVTTALTIVLLLIYRPGDPKRNAVRARPAPEAASGVGGKVDVMVLPASAPPR